MRGLIFILVVLSLLALGAHFLRFSNEVGVISCIVLIGLLFLLAIILLIQFFNDWPPR